MPAGSAHYPYLTRMVASLYAEGALTNVRSVEIEPEFGYVTRIRYIDGGVRMTRGNDAGVNSGAANEVVKDKAQTKYFLRRSGIETPAGESFLLGWWAERLRPRMVTHGVLSLRTADQAAAYVHDHLGYPVYVKPVNGSNGVDVWRVADEDRLEWVLARFAQDRVRVALVERAVDLPDHRLVVLDGEVVSAYRRNPLEVTGDGRSTIAELLDDRQRRDRDQGRVIGLPADDERIAARLKHIGLSWESVPASGEPVRLLDISNLSTGGTADDLTDAVAGRWRRLAADVATALDLRLCGVDLACADLTAGDGGYAVIEVNGAPGLDHYGSGGQAQEARVRGLYLKILNTRPT